MKPVSLALLFALFTLFTKLALTTAVLVYDVNGNPVVNGGSYYAIFNEPGGGAVTLAKVGNETLPISVVLGSFYGNSNKRRVKFHVHGSQISYYVPTNFALDIEFSHTPDGVNSSQWTVGKKDLLVRIDNEEQGILPGIFKIKKNSGTGNVYRIVFCPHGEACFPVGAERVDSGEAQLVVTDVEAIPFVFSRVEGDSATLAI
ncbi:hypothetical protein L6164_000145 [Bauhinia variegata]|uniref:Uncharacterized protein n=1 Tax=Bauhinia variegata TaxID=167791 RepID=A0ACB9Q4V4_BAUVA|nr:hypothetical protein L6164_000145 [Bauhinia variegata]